MQVRLVKANSGFDFLSNGERHCRLYNTARDCRGINTAGCATLLCVVTVVLWSLIVSFLGTLVDATRAKTDVQQWCLWRSGSLGSAALPRNFQEVRQ